MNDHDHQPLATFFADGTESIYLCDPRKNTKCPKTDCFLIIGDGGCHHTSKIKFADDRLKGDYHAQKKCL